MVGSEYGARLCCCCCCLFLVGIIKLSTRLDHNKIGFSVGLIVVVVVVVAGRTLWIGGWFVFVEVIASCSLTLNLFC